jgi:hypothetical protein
MEIVSVRQEATGVIAIGQVATGFLAIGQMATGVIAIGQIARGVVAIGQIAVGGGFALGMVAVTPGTAVGLIGIGTRAAALLPLSMIPKRKPRSEEPVLAPPVRFVEFTRGETDRGWVEVSLAHEDGRIVARERGQVVPIEFEGLAANEALILATGRDRHARVELAAEDRAVSDPVGYRASPEMARTFVASERTRLDRARHRHHRAARRVLVRSRRSHRGVRAQRVTPSDEIARTRHAMRIGARRTECPRCSIPP